MSNIVVNNSSCVGVEFYKSDGAISFLEISSGCVVTQWFDLGAEGVGFNSRPERKIKKQPLEILLLLKFREMLMFVHFQTIGS